MSKTVNVIGAGIAGSIVSTLLRSEGFDVRVFDDEDKLSGSRASSNLFHPAWYTKVKEKATVGFQVLDRLYGKVIERPFDGGIGLAPKMMHIRQEHLLVKPDVLGCVTYADEQGLTLGDTRSFDGPIVLCCGYRHNTVCPKSQLELEVYAGHRFLFRGDLEQGRSRLYMVAPYKHAKLYQYAPGLIYYADSVKIRLDQYQKRQEELKLRTLFRASDALGFAPEIVDFCVGYRPVMRGESMMGNIGHPFSNVWYLNGGGSTGAVAYAFRAQQLVDELKASL